MFAHDSKTSNSRNYEIRRPCIANASRTFARGGCFSFFQGAQLLRIQISNSEYNHGCSFARAGFFYSSERVECTVRTRILLPMRKRGSRRSYARSLVPSDDSTYDDLVSSFATAALIDRPYFKENLPLR